MLFFVKFQQNTYSAISQDFSRGLDFLDPSKRPITCFARIIIISRTIRISGALIDISYLVYSVKHFQLILLWNHV
jgi:hypothetical protein